MVLVGADAAGMDVAREEWGKRLVLVVPLDRASRRRMCEGWRHPDVVRGWDDGQRRCGALVAGG